MMAGAWVMACLFAGLPDTPDFDTQIVPLFTKAGCNAAACHGAAAGRGGFKLSLWGLNPDSDYRAIVHQYGGRRINVVRPEQSLLLLKSSGEIEHEGEAALENAPDGERRILAWIRSGARRGTVRDLLRFEVTPATAAISAVGAAVPLRSLAHFADGTRDDVTPWTVFQLSDPSALELLDDPLRVKILRSGRHVLVARYLDQVVPIVLTLPFDSKRSESTQRVQSNYIDEYVDDTLDRLHIPSSPPASDTTTVRRLYLDLTGRLPTVAEAARFVTDRSPDKRARLVDRLIASDAYVDLWTYRLERLMRVRSPGNDRAALATMHGWLRRQVAEGRPYPQIVTDLITSTGDTHEVGPANFYRLASGARAQAEYVSELFLGARMRCANCHDHPLDAWTQDDFHGLSAIFARVQAGRIVGENPRGAVTHPRTGEAARPRLPGVRFLDPSEDARRSLAQWVTSKDNPYFARAIVNRLWKMMMGRGFIEPTDDLRATNPPTHPKLLDRMVQEFESHNGDLRHVLRAIANSAAYARASQTENGNESDRMFYSHALVRPLEPEVLADALSDVTGVYEQYGELPLGTRAIQLVGPSVPSKSLDILGRCSREASCESLDPDATLAQTLHWLNGPLINKKIGASTGTLHLLLQSDRSNDEVIELLYLRALARPPSPEEARGWLEQLGNASGDERQTIMEDICWSLLVCREFVTNH